jgi:hypothetical protein
MDTTDTVTTPAAPAPAPCACGKDPLACSRTNCTAKLQATADAASAAPATPSPAVSETAPTAPASDPTASLSAILAGIPKDKLPAVVEMFTRLGVPASDAPATGVADSGGGAVKADTGKPALSLIPSSALFGMGAVLTFGAKKYAAHNWRKGMDWSRLLDALLRHTMAVVDGEDTDQETGLPHVYHAMCCLAFLGEYQAKSLGRDDRYKALA